MVHLHCAEKDHLEGTSNISPDHSSNLYEPSLNRDGSHGKHVTSCCYKIAPIGNLPHSVTDLWVNMLV